MLNEVYYAIANKTSRLRFPRSVGPTFGIGGYLNGGGFDLMLRKHMASPPTTSSTPPWWTPRGGSSTGPPWRRTSSGPSEAEAAETSGSSCPGSSGLSPFQPPSRDAFLRVVVPLYLSTRAGLVAAMANTFLELNVTASDCTEMTWIQSVLYFAFYSTGKPSEMLLDRGNGIGDPSGSWMRLARSS
ncbi:hypothetical protein OsI_33215 [Oryza sativa Indica Group]|uniref:Uncharacterized protein n=1 Tax=Oryza sativa subsp. indica TaxID=39946 RepID=B8BGD3_ORYSI|nr:hypothetical protein OsI_33215 [Oryza sativa Indica Group]